MTIFDQEDANNYLWQRIDRLLKLLEDDYPNIVLPFCLSIKGIQYERINDLSGEIQLPVQLWSKKPNKFTADLLQEGKAKFRNSDNWRSVVAYAEYMHYNQTDYGERLDVVYRLLHYKYKCDDVIPLVVYTGHKKCQLEKILKRRYGNFRCELIDLTMLKPKITMEHPLFIIRFMTIFNHRLSNKNLADFFIREFERLRDTVDEKEFYRFAIYIQLATTPRNAMAVKAIHKHLFKNKPAEYYHELLKDTPLYEDLMRFHNEDMKKVQTIAETEAKARKAAEAAEAKARKAAEAAEAKARIAAEKARAEAEAKARIAAEKARAEAEAKAQIAAEKARAEAEAKARIANAVRFIQDYGLTVAQVAQTLSLTDAEITALEAALKA